MKNPLQFFGKILIVSLILTWHTAAGARTVTLDNLAFIPPMQPTNVIDLTLATDVAGNSSDMTVVSGSASAQLDFDVHGTQIIPTGLTFTGGQIALSDVSFSFLFGLLQVQATGIEGFPSTISPPGLVQNNQFNAAEHQLTFDAGMINAPGNSVDLSQTPLTGPGSGLGQVQVVPIGSPVGADYTFAATISLPIEINESYMIPNVPVVGDVTATLLGSGTAVSRQEFTITILPGDFNGDGALDCTDITDLEQAVAGGSMDLTYDANLDGTVDGADVTYWLDDLRAAIPGDANLNDVVDGEDFIVWNANKFLPVSGWCAADFDENQLVDGRDFIIWNEYKFTSANAVAVPESPPTLLWGQLSALVLLTSLRRMS